MSCCPYYWYNYNSYACHKAGKDINSDLYDKYCSTYDYRDCPIYRAESSSSSSSGCFLTSACVEAKNLPDDCYELTTLRAFRDDYMRSIPEGAADICEYYHVAPGIVEKIRQLPNAMDVFNQIYDELVTPCVKLIEEGKNKEAHEAYRNYVLKLRTEYAN